MMFIMRRIKKIGLKDFDKLQIKMVVIAISILWKLTTVALFMILFEIVAIALGQLIIFEKTGSVFKNLVNSIQSIYTPSITILGLTLILFVIIFTIGLYLVTNWILVKFVKWILIVKVGIDKEKMDEALLEEKPNLLEPIRLIKENVWITLKGIIRTNWFHYFVLGFLYKIISSNFNEPIGVIGTVLLAFIFGAVRIIISYKEEKNLANKLQRNLRS